MKLMYPVYFLDAAKKGQEDGDDPIEVRVLAVVDIELLKQGTVFNFPGEGIWEMDRTIPFEYTGGATEGGGREGWTKINVYVRRIR